MRLLVCVPWFAPARAFGGTVTVAVATVKGALEAGHEVTVATTDALDLHSRVPAGYAERAGGRAGDPASRTSRSGWRPTNVPLPRGLRRWLREHVEEFDVGAAASTSTRRASVLAARAARARRRAVRAAGAGNAAGDAGARSRRRQSARSWRSGGGERCARRPRASTCRRSSGGVPRPGRRPGASAPICRRRSTSRAGRVPRAAAPTVVYLGQLHPIKRIDVLLDAFARVRAELPEARLEVIGAPSTHGEELRARQRARNWSR